MLDGPESGDKPAPGSSRAPIHPGPAPIATKGWLRSDGVWGPGQAHPSTKHSMGVREPGQGCCREAPTWAGGSLEREKRVQSTSEALLRQRHLIHPVWPSLRGEAGNAQAAQGQGRASGISESQAGWVVSDSAWAHFPSKRPAWVETRARKP